MTVPTSVPVTVVRNFLLANVDKLCGGSAGEVIGVADTGFQISPREYLTFAEEQLKQTTDQSRINCVAHLKRAVDCQLDTFLHTYNLYSFARTRNLSFHQKLDFLHDIGVFSSRSLRRLNEIRNRMEHEYALPNISDLEVYADLVQAFVAVLESTIVLVPCECNDGYSLHEDGDEFKPQVGTFDLTYERDEPRLTISWTLSELPTSFSATPLDPEFAYFFRVYVVLHRLRAFETDDYIRKLLEDTR